jgi:hypothetical protein
MSLQESKSWWMQFWNFLVNLQLNDKTDHDKADLVSGAFGLRKFLK